MGLMFLPVRKWIRIFWKGGLALQSGDLFVCFLTEICLLGVFGFNVIGNLCFHVNFKLVQVVEHRVAVGLTGVVSFLFEMPDFPIWDF